MDKNRFLKKRYKVFPFPSWKVSFFLREKTGIAPVFSSASDSRKAIFMHIPKAAGSSVGDLIFGTDIIGHYPYFVYQKYNPVKFKAYYKFTVVRDPVARLYSAYNFVLSGGKGGADEKCGNFIRLNSNGFEDFVANVMSEEFIYTWVHFVPQTYFVFDENETCMVDKLVRLENIEGDFQEVREKLGVKGELPFSNSGSNKSDIVISDATRSKIYSLYEKDYRLLGY
ncbi:MAG: sulfotransferase family 2 domain-containing protein [Colwellia sp.]|jgi:Sulfotransferase family.